MRDRLLDWLFGTAESFLTGVAMLIFGILGCVVVILGVVVGVMRWSRNRIDAQIDALLERERQRIAEELRKAEEEKREAERKAAEEKKAAEDRAEADKKADPVVVGNSIINE